MKKEEIINENISSNIAYYRQLNNLTQYELAKKLNYSDKSISKWERGEGVPSIYILNELASFFNISLNDLVNKKHVRPRKNKQAKPLLYSLISWLVALITFIILVILHVDYKSWLLFIIAASISGLIFFIFNLVWRKKLYYNLALAVFLFALATFLHLTFLVKPYIYYVVATAVYIFTAYLLYYLSKRKS